ncbi:MAG: DUF418 domain-containing protein [Bacteroidia bacterium]|nr:DUF418 domain-containing protein [Bacteroidia bacterium]
MAETLSQEISNTSSNSRIIYLDVLRGIAILGILMINIPSFGMSTYFSGYNPVLDKAGSANYYTWFWSFVFFNGKMRGIFTLLFGAGILLFMDKNNSEKNSLPRADAYFRRMLWLLFFGLVDSYLILWTGDILYEYALCGMLLFAFRRMKPRGLIIIFSVFFVIMAYLSCQGFMGSKEKRANFLQTETLLKQGKKLTKEQLEQREEWQNVVDYTYPYPKKIMDDVNAKANEQIKIARSGYGSVMEGVWPLVTESHTIGFYVDCWESFSAILLGMALYKMGLFSGKLKKKVYLWLIAIGIGIGLPLAYWVAWSNTISTNYIEFYIDNRWMSINPFEQISRIMIMLGYIGLVMLIGVSGWLKGFQNIMAKVGRMAFTNYLMQSLICTFIFFGYGFGMFAKLQRYELLYVVLGVWIFQIIFSVMWLKFFTMGPLEWLWRSLIYWKRMPMKITRDESK